MNKAYWAVAAALLAGHAIAQDYVGRAHTSCAAVDGRARYGLCMASAAQSICNEQLAPVRAGCYKDFERHHYARADQVNAQRRALAVDVEQRIDRLRTLSQGKPASAAHYNPNPVRTLDDGLPDIQPSWGAGGNPYEHLTRLTSSPMPVAASARPQPPMK